VKFRIDNFGVDMARADIVRKERKKWYARHARLSAPVLPAAQEMLRSEYVESVYERNKRLAREAGDYDMQRARERAARKGGR
jgi:hypothetical protein